MRIPDAFIWLWGAAYYVGLILRTLLESAQPKIVPFMHSFWLFFAEFDCAAPSQLFRHNVAAFVCFQQKECVIGIHPSTIAKPADAAVRNELMYPALNMNAEGVPRKPRSLMELSIRAVQQLHIVGVRIP
jgi:hypothetical protein